MCFIEHKLMYITLIYKFDLQNSHYHTIFFCIINTNIGLYFQYSPVSKQYSAIEISEV